MNPPAFQFYADDFLAGTMDLSPEEVGAYIRLLCAQWSRGYIVPDPARIDRIAGCPVPPVVLAKFDQGEDGNLRNARLEREREKQNEFRNGRSEAGKKGAAKRWQKNSSAIAKPSPSHGLANGLAIDLPLANGMANDSSPSPSPSSINTVPAKGAEPPPDLEEIYQAYPKKVAKPEALRAIAKAVAADGFDHVLKRTRMFGTVCNKPRQFVPNPSTFFNQRRYADDPETWKDHADHSRNNPQSFDRGQGTCNADVVNDYAGR